MNERSESQVIVSERAYKATTIFTTLISIALMFVGFYVIDKSINWPVGSSIDPILALTGLGVMLIAAGLYVFSLRFKTEMEVEHGR